MCFRQAESGPHVMVIAAGAPPFSVMGVALGALLPSRLTGEYLFIRPYVAKRRDAEE